MMKKLFSLFALLALVGQSSLFACHAIALLGGVATPTVGGVNLDITHDASTNGCTYWAWVEIQPVGTPYTNTANQGYAILPGTGTSPTAYPTYFVSLPAGTYHWQAREEVVSGNYGPWTDFGTFTVGPSCSQPTVQGATQCGPGIVTLTGTPGTGGLTLRWYDAPSNGNLLATGLSYSANFTVSDTLYVTSWDSLTPCESARRSVIVTVSGPSFTTTTTQANCSTATGSITINPTNCGGGGSATTTYTLTTPYYNNSSPTDFDVAEYSFTAVSNVVSFSITSSGPYFHSHGSSCDLLISLYDANSSSWIQVYTQTATSNAQINLTGLTSNFTSIPSVTKLRLDSNPYQSQSFHSVTSFTLTLTSQGPPPCTYAIDNQPYGQATLFSNLAPGTYAVRVRDANGCIVTNNVNVVSAPDPTPPVVACQNATVQLNATGNATITSTQVMNGPATDNCSVSGTTASPTAFNCSHVGQQNVTVTATDGAGNTATCNATVTVQDVSVPSAVCNNVTVQLNGSGHAATTGFDVGGGSSDACGIQTLGLSDSTFTCLDLGNVSVTLTATDAHGNFSTCSAVVRVEDNTAPVAQCQNVTVTLDSTGHGSIQASAVDNGSSDACGLASLQLSPFSFNCSNLGSNNAVLTVSDANGNVASCASVITVTETEAPVARCRNVVVTLNVNGQGSTTAQAVDNGSTDMCGIGSMTLSQTSFTTSNLGTNSVTLTVTDLAGNTSTCTAVVTVESTPNAIGEPAATAIFPAHPNPFSETTQLGFRVNHATHAELRIFTIRGEEIARLFEGEAEPGTDYQAEWDATRYSSGIYFARLITGDGGLKVEKLILEK